MRPLLSASRNLAFLLLLIVLGIPPVLAQDAIADAARPPRPVGDPVLPGVWRLTGNDPEGPLDDLEPLRLVIGKATVVGLGETVHTSGGYYRMKHRLFRFLVERMGFRVFAFESPWTDADQVAAYVQTCDGDPRQAIRGLFGVWQSTEVADLVQWMCDWNLTHPKPKDRLSFVGFDIQQPEDDGPGLIEFLGRIGVAGDSSWIAAIQACEAVTIDHFPGRVPEAAHQQCIQGLQEVEEHFQRNARTIQRQTSKLDLEMAKLRLVGLRAWEYEAYYRARNDGLSYTYRDEGMAYALRTLRALRFPKSKIAVWAHNSHVSRDAHPINGGRPMGSFLAAALGAAYASVGLAAWEVGIDWPGVGCGLISVLTDGSAEQVLHNLGETALLLDLDFPGAAEPLLEPGASYYLGSRFMVPRQHFDGLVFLESSPKMTPTLRASCQ